MFLTKQQEKMLEGEMGEVISKNMSLIVKLGEINEAKKLIPIKSAQIAGVSYFTVGEAIFSFFNLFSKENVKVKVPSWLNPAGMDRKNWEKMGITERFAEKQFQIIQKYEEMGVESTLTCTPYLIGYQPNYGEHLAWSESSAVVMANSFFGARTNREGGPSALAAALTGFTAEYGFHLTEKRQPTIKVNVETNLDTLADFSALGYWYGKNFHGETPFITGLSQLSINEAKMLSSAIAASGSVTLFHAKNLSPESEIVSLDNIKEKIIFSESEKQSVYDCFTQKDTDFDLVVIGCPHASLTELVIIHRSLKDKVLKRDLKFWVFTSQKVSNGNKFKSIQRCLEKKRIEIFTDTCMVVSPIVRTKYKHILTNSAKASKYLSNSKQTKVTFRSLHHILRSVTE
jgi:predicted aconitase